ncbi:MAG: ribosomal-processing cysteine protease Prp [Oscillospiraceae bacterium]
MTRFAYIRRDGRCVLRADGHADFCPGRDIVCAGASALVRAGGRARCAGRAGRAADALRRTPAIAADDRADVRAAFTVAVTGLRQLAAAYPGHVAEDTGRVPAQETETHGSAAAGRCPGAVPGSGQQRKKET